MAAFIDGKITCDHEGCKSTAPTTFEIVGLEHDIVGRVVPYSWPEGWLIKRPSHFVIKEVFFCPEHNK